MDNARCKVLLIEDGKIDQKAFKRLVDDEKLIFNESGK